MNRIQEIKHWLEEGNLHRAEKAIQNCTNDLKPEEKEEFLALMKEKGLYEECSMLCFPKLQSKYLKGELHKDIHEKITKEKDWRISLSNRKVGGEEE